MLMTRPLIPLFAFALSILLAAPALAGPASDHYTRGLALKKAGKLDEAIAAMNRALEIRADYAAVHQSIGVCYRKKKDYASAEKHLKQAVKLEPRWANAYYSLGLVLFHLNKKDEAIAAMEKAAELDPKDPLPPEQLGVLYGRKDPKKAVLWLNKACQLKPNDARIRHKLGIAHRRAGQFKEAEAALLLAASNSMTAGLAFDLGVMFRRKKEHRKAVIYYKKAIKMDPKMADAPWDLGHVYEVLKEKDNAVKAYEAFLKLKSVGSQADKARERLELLKGTARPEEKKEEAKPQP